GWIAHVMAHSAMRAALMRGHLMIVMAHVIVSGVRCFGHHLMVFMARSHRWRGGFHGVIVRIVRTGCGVDGVLMGHKYGLSGRDASQEGTTDLPSSRIIPLGGIFWKPPRTPPLSPILSACQERRTPALQRWGSTQTLSAVPPRPGRATLGPDPCVIRS